MLSFENENGRTSHAEYFLPKVEIKDYNVKIDGKNILEKPIKNDATTYENIRKTVTGQGGDYTTAHLLDYPYFKENYKMISIDLSKQEALDADPRAIQEINFTTNIDRPANTTMFFITGEAKEADLDFS